MNWQALIALLAIAIPASAAIVSYILFRSIVFLRLGRRAYLALSLLFIVFTFLSLIGAAIYEKYSLSWVYLGIGLFIFFMIVLEIIRKCHQSKSNQIL